MLLQSRELWSDSGYLDSAGILLPSAPCNDDSVPVAGDANVTRTVEEDHRARMFVHGRFVGNFFYVDIEDGAGGKIDGLGVHQVAFEEKLDPAAVFGDSQYDAGDAFDRVNDLVSVGESFAHAIDL